MTKKIVYGVIGNNWGNRIYSILKFKKKNVCKLKTITFFKNDKNEYLNYLTRSIKQKKINLVWLAINPFKNYHLIKFLIDKNINLVIEKPWTHSEIKTKNMIQTIKNKKVKVFFHFEFIFLSILKNLDKKKINSINLEFKTKFKKKSKIPLKYEFGSHLAAIKIFHFNNIRKVFYSYGYNKQQNVRRVIIHYDSKKKILDFSNNKENIIAKFINFVEISIKRNLKNYLDLNFAMKVNREINKNKN